MAVSTVTIWALNPGGGAQFFAAAAKAKAIHERLGAKVRVRQIAVGGPNTGQIVYTIEHANMAEYATFTDKLNVDAEWVALWGAEMIANPKPSASVVSHSFTSDVPGF